MADEFDFKVQIQKTGVSKKEILDFLKENKVQVNEADIDSVFTEFNSNKIGDSKDVLDMDEQAALLSFIQNKAGSDTKLTKAEFNDDTKFDLFQKFMQGYEGVRDKEKKDNKDITISGDSVKVGEDAKYKTDASKKVVVSKTSKDSTNTEVTQVYKNASNSRRVHLDDGWNGERIYAKKITGNENGYKDIKDVEKSKTADEVCTTLLDQIDLDLTDEQFKKLSKDLVKYNPSMFEKDGSVYLNADWSKLDFPTKEFIEKHYSGKASGGDDDKVDNETAEKLAKGKVSGQRLGAELYVQLRGASLASNSREVLDKVNENNVVDAVETFNSYSIKNQNEYVLQYISEEWGLKGNDINKIISPLLVYAKNIGISENNENYKKLKAEEEHYNSLGSSSVGSSDYAKKVDAFVNDLIKDINKIRSEKENHTPEAPDKNTLVSINSTEAKNEGERIAKAIFYPTAPTTGYGYVPDYSGNYYYTEMTDLNPNNVTHFLNKLTTDSNLNAAIESNSKLMIQNLLKCASNVGLEGVQEYKILQEWQTTLLDPNYKRNEYDKSLLSDAIRNLNALIQKQIGASK